VQLVRKSDGAVDHDGSDEWMGVQWEALSSGSSSILAPNDLAAVSGFVGFNPGEVNNYLLSFTLVVTPTTRTSISVNQTRNFASS